MAKNRHQAFKAAFPDNKQIENIDLPTSLNLEVADVSATSKTVFMKLKATNMYSNMQKDRAAIESWCIILKAILQDQIKEFVIQWKTPFVDEGGELTTEQKHYKRFKYRMREFERTFDWIRLDTNDKTYNEFQSVVMNVPTTHESVIDKKSHNANRLAEYLLVEDYVKRHSTHQKYYVQLPVGLFKGLKSRKDGLTPGGAAQIDMWSINGDTIHLYEVKAKENKPAGIISELMCYAFIMKDVLAHKIMLDERAKEAMKQAYRGYDEFYPLWQSQQLTKIDAVFLTKEIHTEIKENKDAIFKLFNESQYLKDCNISFRWDNEIKDTHDES